MDWGAGRPRPTRFPLGGMTDVCKCVVFGTQKVRWIERVLMDAGYAVLDDGFRLIMKVGDFVSGEQQR